MNLTRRNLFASLGKAAVAAPIIAVSAPALVVAEPVNDVLQARKADIESKIATCGYSMCEAIGEDLVFDLGGR